MEIERKAFMNFRRILGLFSLSTLLLATSCNTDEATSTAISGDNINDLSSKSVELSVNSNNLTASNSHSNYPVTNAVDGRTSTRWTGLGEGTTLIIDLEREDFIDYIKVAHYKGSQRKYKFAVYTKSSGSDDWNLVGTKTSSGKTNSLYTYDVKNSTGRYIKIVSNGNTSNKWSDITELEVYGTEGEVATDECVAKVPGDRKASSITANTATLSWEAITNVDHYNVRYKSADKDSWSYVYSLDTNSTTLEGLIAGKEYDWQLRVKCANGDATDYKEAVATFTTTGNGTSEEEENREEENKEEETTSNPIIVGAGNAEVPADLMINCDQWKITYPDGEEEKKLCDEDNNEYFFVSEEGNALVFRAPIRSNNGTTPNSSYIRSELRERTEDGGSDIFWTTDGKSVVYAKQAITHLPTEKNHLVATQIHGDKSEGIDDSMVLRLEGSHLFLSFNGGKLRDDFTIKTNYQLGAVHEVIFEVIDGKHYCYYSEDGNLASAYRSGNASQYLVKDGSKDYVMDISYGKSYFKIGNYTQSNSEREGSSTDNPDNYGEVYVYDFWVLHED